MKDKPLKQVCYYKDGQLHNEGLNPAIVEYDRKGNIIEERYYKFGVKFTKEFLEQDFSKIDPKIVLQEKNAQRRMALTYFNSERMNLEIDQRWSSR